MDKYEARRAALIALRESIGHGAIRKIAEKIGKDPSYVSRMLYPPSKSGYKRIGEDSLDDLNRAFPNWFIDPDSTPSPTGKDGEHIGSISNTTKTTDVTIEQYDPEDVAGAMGYGLELRDQPGVIQSWRVSKDWLNQNVKNHSGSANLCIVTGFGDSMQPMFNPGDPLLVDLGVTCVEFDAVFFFRVGTEGYIKRLQRIPTEDGLVIRAISENKSAYEAFNITPKMDFQVLGRVLKVWRSQEF